MLILLLALIISGFQPSVDVQPAHIIPGFFSGISAEFQTETAERQTESLTTIIFVRHAETEEVPGDVNLNEEGKKRAHSLAVMLEDAGIAAVYTTPYNRTRQTAEVVAEAHGHSVQEYDPRDPQALDTIVRDNAGKTVLVTGHSNTTPMMVNHLLGEQRFEQLQETDYGNIYIVTIDNSGTATVLHLRY